MFLYIIGKIHFAFENTSVRFTTEYSLGGKTLCLLLGHKEEEELWCLLEASSPFMQQIFPSIYYVPSTELDSRDLERVHSPARQTGVQMNDYYRVVSTRLKCHVNVT